MAPTSRAESDELDLRAYVSILRRRWRWIAGALAATVLIALVFTVQQTPKYRATAELLVNTQVESVIDEANRLNAADAERQLNNEIQIIESGRTRDAVREAYDGPLDVDSVSASIASDRSDAIRVSASGSDADEVAELVNTYVATYVDLRQNQRIEEILAAGNQIQAQIDRIQGQIDDLTAPLVQAENALAADPDDGALVAQRDRVAAQVQGDVAPLENQQAFYRQQLENLQLTAGLAQSGGPEILTDAEAPGAPSSPKPLRNVALALVLGGLLGVGVAFLRDYFDESIRSIDDLERLTGGEPTLGIIPFVEHDHGQRLATMHDPTSVAAEAYRGLRTGVRFAALDRRMKVIQVTSASLGEGKTTTVANLAVALAQAGQKVVITCCDLRRPRVHEVFDQPLGPGFTDLLLGEATLTQALRKVGPNLYLLPAGSRPPNPSELLGSARTDAVIKALEAEFDYVLLDTTPILPVTDGIVMSSMAHAVLVVVSARHTTRGRARQALALLRQADAPVVGFVLNGVPIGGRYGYRYGYTYGYGYEESLVDGDDGRRSRRGRTAAKAADAPDDAELPAVR